jgi:cell division protein DivIC
VAKAVAKPKKEKPKTFRLSSLIVRGACAVLIISMLAAYISNRVEIATRNQELASLKAQLQQQNEENDELQRVLESDDDTIQERIARDTYGYAAPNERVFIDMSGK